MKKLRRCEPVSLIMWKKQQENEVNMRKMFMAVKCLISVLQAPKLLFQNLLALSQLSGRQPRTFNITHILLLKQAQGFYHFLEKKLDNTGGWFQ